MSETVTLETDEVPFNVEDLLKAGHKVSQILDYIESYYSEGILPSCGRQVSPDGSSIEKSIHSKYPQYQVKQYVDVKRRSLRFWGLVGNGNYYPDVYNDRGELVTAGCGHLWRDEGIGCLHAKDHVDGLARIRLIANTCMRPQCPVCYEKWAGREAHRIDERFRRVPKLNGERRDLAESRTPWGVPIHLVISVPELESVLMDYIEIGVKKGKFVKINGFTKLKRKMSKIAKRVGFKGGCAIFHPFANDELGEDDEVECQVDPESGEFDFTALKEYFAKQNKNVKLWYIRPHFHLIGYGWIEDTDVEFSRSGWIAKNLGVRNSVMSTALYQLSHAGYREGQHTVSWLGFMSNRLFKSCNPYPPEGFRVQVCPECGAELVHIKWVGEGNSPLDSVGAEGIYRIDPIGWIEIPYTEYRGRIVHVH